MIKHKRRISFKELSEGKHPFYLDLDNYNSHQTLIISDISHIIKCLKNYHHELKNYVMPLFPVGIVANFNLKNQQMEV